VSADFPLLAEAAAFRPVGAAGRPIFRWDRPEYAMFYAPGCLCVVGRTDAARFEAAILAQGGEIPWMSTSMFARHDSIPRHSEERSDEESPLHSTLSFRGA
jgi:hypothetical protein